MSELWLKVLGHDDAVTVSTSRPILGESHTATQASIRVSSQTRGRPKICYASGGLNQNVQVVEATCCARNFPLSWYGTSWCSISVLLRDGLVTPDLTGTQHRMHSAGEAASGSHAGDLPTEALLHLLVGLR